MDLHLLIRFWKAEKSLINPTRRSMIEYNTTGDVTANIVVSAYSTMVSRVEELTSKQLFDFLYTNKRIPAVIGLGAQYDRLLYWVSNSTYSNPLIDKAGFESEIAKLNSMS